MVSNKVDVIGRKRPGDAVLADDFNAIVERLKRLEQNFATRGQGGFDGEGFFGSAIANAEGLTLIKSATAVPKYGVTFGVAHDGATEELVNGEAVVHTDTDIEDLNAIYIAQSDIEANATGYAIGPQAFTPFIVEFSNGPGSYGDMLGPVTGSTSMSLDGGWGYKFLHTVNADGSGDLAWVVLDMSHFSEVVVKLSQTIGPNSSGIANVVKGEMDAPLDTGNPINVYNYFHGTLTTGKLCVCRLLRTADTSPKLVITETLFGASDVQLVQVYDGNPFVAKNGSCVFPARIVTHGVGASGMCDAITGVGASCWLWLPNDASIDSIASGTTTIAKKHLDTLQVGGDTRPMYAGFLNATNTISILKMEADVLTANESFLGDDGSWVGVETLIGTGVNETHFLSATTSILNPSKLFFSGGDITLISEQTGPDSYVAVILNVEHESVQLSIDLLWESDFSAGALKHTPIDYPLPNQDADVQSDANLFITKIRTFEFWNGVAFEESTGQFIEATALNPSLTPVSIDVVADWRTDAATKEIVEDKSTIKVFDASATVEERTATFECP